MRVLVAPDKFKGSLTATQVAEHVAAGLNSAAPGVLVDRLPVADGGDGVRRQPASDRGDLRRQPGVLSREYAPGQPLPAGAAAG